MLTAKQRIDWGYHRSTTKPKPPQRTPAELAEAFDIQESINRQMGYEPRNKEETLKSWQTNCS